MGGNRKNKHNKSKKEKPETPTACVSKEISKSDEIPKQENPDIGTRRLEKYNEKRRREEEEINLLKVNREKEKSQKKPSKGGIKLRREERKEIINVSDNTQTSSSKDNKDGNKAGRSGGGRASNLTASTSNIRPSFTLDLSRRSSDSHDEFEQKPRKYQSSQGNTNKDEEKRRDNSSSRRYDAGQFTEDSRGRTSRLTEKKNYQTQSLQPVFNRENWDEGNRDNRGPVTNPTYSSRGRINEDKPRTANVRYSTRGGMRDDRTRERPCRFFLPNRKGSQYLDSTPESSTNSDMEEYRGYPTQPSYNRPWNFRQDNEKFKPVLGLIHSDEVIINEKYTEITGDLFNAPEEYSLAHCVAEDMRMGAGIALLFRKKFSSVGELLQQGQQTGGLAVLKDKDRFIYYLVTKRLSHSKPTLQSLWTSLRKLKQHCLDNNVKKLAMPQIGCGLDRLNWDDVSRTIKYVFKGEDIEIAIYTLGDASDSRTLNVLRKCYVEETEIQLIDLETPIGFIYFGTVEADISVDMQKLAKKYNFIEDYKSAKKTFGDVIRRENKEVVLYGLIARKSKNDNFNFPLLEKCVFNLRSCVSKDKLWYVAFEHFETDDYLITDKIVSLMQFILRDVTILVSKPKKTLAVYK